MNRLFIRQAASTLVVHRVVFILLATLLASALIVPAFLTLTTAGVGLDRAATMGLIAVGLTVLLIAGQIDLSGGATLALTGIVSIVLQPAIGLFPAAVVGLLVGVVVGAVNGFLVVALRINSMVATLASMLAVRAVAHWITASQPVSGGDIEFALEISQTFWEIFTLRSFLFVVSILALHFWLTRTVEGRNLFAVGSNELAARASGIRTNRYFFGGFIFAGFCAGVAGVIQSLSVNTGSPVFGANLTVTVIAAVVVGGTRLEGGRGSALGTLGGVLTLAALTTAMEFQSVPAYIQDIVTGTILIVLIVADRFASSGAGRTLKFTSFGRRGGAAS
jgi:ribose/xylose/arabinose/galactoside ABC-type transport system permease subunit